MIHKISAFARKIEAIALKSDSLIPHFPVKENCEKLVSLRDINLLRFDDKIDKYLVRTQVHEKMERIVNKCKKLGYSLYVCEAFRSLEKQKLFWYQALLKAQESHPDEIDGRKLLELTSKFTAPPERAMHCTGGTVDVLLFSNVKQEILFDFDDSDESYYNELVYTDNPLISEEEKKVRQTLNSLMESEDFVNYPLEWWHYSFGNAEWALYKGKDFAFYGQTT